MRKTVWWCTNTFWLKFWSKVMREDLIWSILQKAQMSILVHIVSSHITPPFFLCTFRRLLWACHLLETLISELHPFPINDTPPPPPSPPYFLNFFQPFHQKHSYPLSLPPSFLPSFFIYWSKTYCVPLLYPFTSPCLCLIHLSFFIHHAPSHFSLSVSPSQLPSPHHLSFFHHLLLTSLLLFSISPGCGVLHPGSVFRVITRLVNSFMASTLSVTHAGHMPARSGCIQLTHLYTVRRCALFLRMQVNTKSTRKLAISGCEKPDSNDTLRYPTSVYRGKKDPKTLWT